MFCQAFTKNRSKSYAKVHDFTEILSKLGTIIIKIKLYWYNALYLYQVLV